MKIFIGILCLAGSVYLAIELFHGVLKTKPIKTKLFFGVAILIILCNGLLMLFAPDFVDKTRLAYDTTIGPYVSLATDIVFIVVGVVFVFTAIRSACLWRKIPSDENAHEDTLTSTKAPSPEEKHSENSPNESACLTAARETWLLGHWAEEDLFDSTTKEWRKDLTEEEKVLLEQWDNKFNPEAYKRCSETYIAYIIHCQEEVAAQRHRAEVAEAALAATRLPWWKKIFR